jgi:MFS-type transporter involved in bile tolerance (Atg22 family)
VVAPPPRSRVTASPRRLAAPGSLLCTSTINFFNFFLLAIFVLYTSRTLGLGAGTIGVVLGVAAVGALIGAVIAPRVGRRIGIGRAVLVGAVLFPVPMALFPLAHGSHLVESAMCSPANSWRESA